MNRIATRHGRPYRSTLREEQADETRVRILDATVRVMAGGIALLSVPAVAREAGVSVPTVYRHFGKKRELLAALYPHLVHRSGLEALPLPSSAADLGDRVRAIFERVDTADDLARAAMASPAAEEARRNSMPGRFALGRTLAASIGPGFAPDDRDRLARILTILTTSSSLRVWRDYLGATVDVAADDIDWLVRIAAAAAASGSN